MSETDVKSRGLKERVVETLLQAGAVGVICLYVLVALGQKLDANTAEIRELNGSMKVLIEQHRANGH